MLGQAPARATKPCPCRCGTEGLCAGHKARLAGIRAQLERGSAWVQGDDNQHRRGRGPRCVNPACGEPRVPPAAFCVQCQQEGWCEE